MGPEESKRLRGRRGTLATVVGNELEKNKKNYRKANIIETGRYWHLNRQSIKRIQKSINRCKHIWSFNML